MESSTVERSTPESSSKIPVSIARIFTARVAGVATGAMDCEVTFTG